MGGSRTAQLRIAATPDPVKRTTDGVHDPTQRKPLGRSIGVLKTVSTQRVNDLRNTPGAQHWQRNSHERVVGGSLALDALRSYVANNPVSLVAAMI